MKRELFGRTTLILTCDCGWERFASGEAQADRFEREHLTKKHPVKA